MKMLVTAALGFLVAQTAVAADWQFQGREGRTVLRPTFQAATLSEVYFESSSPGPFDLAFKIQDRGVLCVGAMRVTWVMRNRLENRAAGELIAVNCENGDDFSGLTGTPVSADGLGGFVLTCLRSGPQGCTNAILRTGSQFTLVTTRKPQ